MLRKLFSRLVRFFTRKKRAKANTVLAEAVLTAAEEAKLQKDLEKIDAAITASTNIWITWSIKIPKAPAGGCFGHGSLTHWRP